MKVGDLIYYNFFNPDKREECKRYVVIQEIKEVFEDAVYVYGNWFNSPEEAKANSNGKNEYHWGFNNIADTPHFIAESHKITDWRKELQ